MAEPATQHGRHADGRENHRQRRAEEGAGDAAAGENERHAARERPIASVTDEHRRPCSGGGPGARRAGARAASTARPSAGSSRRQSRVRARRRGARVACAARSRSRLRRMPRQAAAVSRRRSSPTASASPRWPSAVSRAAATWSAWPPTSRIRNADTAPPASRSRRRPSSRVKITTITSWTALETSVAAASPPACIICVLRRPERSDIGDPGASLRSPRGVRMCGRMDDTTAATVPPCERRSRRRPG